MRLVEELVDLVPGESARGRRMTRPEDWYFQGHFPGDPVVPAIVLIELLAQTGGLAAASPGSSLRVASVGPFKFPAAARPNQLLEAHARIVGKAGGAVKIDGEVMAEGQRVAAGTVTLVDVSR
jgi:3-hydroxyacyl-[acyl-carrier-protein] dehydratase